MLKKATTGALVLGALVLVLAGCTTAPPADPLARIVYDEVPGLCFGEDANVAGVSVQVCQSSSPGEAFVRATAPVPGQAGCSFANPELELWASQNAGPKRLLVLGPDSDLAAFVYDTGFDVVNGPITVEVTRASHSSVVICE